jgi:hypothetical protein
MSNFSQKGFTKNFLQVMKNKENECCELFTDGQYNFYVEKKYTGKADLRITTSGISSSNDSYNRQLSNAKMGDPNNPYPSIWHAQEEAKALAAQGIVSNLVMRTGYVETVGSPTLTQNGDSTGNALVNEEPNVKVNNDTASKQLFSIAQKNINYVFEPDSGVVNICKAYPIQLINIDKRISTSTSIDPNLTVDDISVWETDILGMGEFKWLYGQINGFSCSVISMLGIPNLRMNFEAELLSANMFDQIIIRMFSEINFTVNKFWMYEGRFEFSNPYRWEVGGLTKPKLNIKINDYRLGQNLFTGLGTSANDFWSGFITNNLNNGADINIEIDTVNFNLWSVASQLYFFATPNSIWNEVKNTNFSFKIDNFRQTILNEVSRDKTGLFGIYSYMAIAQGQITPVHVNNKFYFEFGSATVTIPLFSHFVGSLMGMHESSLTINVLNSLTNTSTLNTIFDIGFANFVGGNQFMNDTCQNNQVVMKGRYIGNASRGLFEPGDFRYSAPNISPNFIAFRFEDAVLIQKAATGPCLNLNLADWNDLINLSLANVSLANVSGNTIQTTDPCNVLIQDVQSSNPIDAAVTQVGGTVVVVPTLSNYLKN